MLRLFNRPAGAVLIAFPWLVVALGLFTLCVFTLVGAIREPIPLELGMRLAVTLVVIFLLLGLGLSALGLAVGLWKLEERARFAAKMMAAIWSSSWALFLVIGTSEAPLPDAEGFYVLVVILSALAFNVWSFWYLSRRIVKGAFAPAILPLNLEDPSSSAPAR